jgi:hypothetical protein
MRAAGPRRALCRHSAGAPDFGPGGGRGGWTLTTGPESLLGLPAGSAVRRRARGRGGRRPRSGSPGSSFTAPCVRRRSRPPPWHSGDGRGAVIDSGSRSADAPSVVRARTAVKTGRRTSWPRPRRMTPLWRSALLRHRAAPCGCRRANRRQGHRLRRYGLERGLAFVSERVFELKRRREGSTTMPALGPGRRFGPDADGKRQRGARPCLRSSASS